MDDEKALLRSMGEQDHCLNCGAARDAVFCGQCGQRFVTGRLSLRGLLREIPVRVFALDGPFLATAIALWKGPGAVARSFVLGQRKRWVNPVTFFLLAASMQLLALAILAPDLKTRIEENFETSRSASPEQFDQLDQVLGGKAEVELARLYLATMRQGYTYVAFVCFCFPFAIFLRLLHAGDEVPYRLGEHLVLSIYTVSQLLIATALSNLVFFSIAEKLQFAAAMTLYFVYAFLAHRGFYPRGIGSAVRSMVAFVAAALVFVSSLVAVFVFTLVLRVIWAKLTGA